MNNQPPEAMPMAVETPTRCPASPLSPTTPSPSAWKHSAARAADNLLRILADMELDGSGAANGKGHGLREILQRSFDGATDDVDGSVAGPHEERGGASTRNDENDRTGGNNGISAARCPRSRRGGGGEVISSEKEGGGASGGGSGGGEREQDDRETTATTSEPRAHDKPRIISKDRDRQRKSQASGRCYAAWATRRHRTPGKGEEKENDKGLQRQRRGAATPALRILTPLGSASTLSHTESTSQLRDDAGFLVLAGAAAVVPFRRNIIQECRATIASTQSKHCRPSVVSSLKKESTRNIAHAADDTTNDDAKDETFGGRAVKNPENNYVGGERVGCHATNSASTEPPDAIGESSHISGDDKAIQEPTATMTPNFGRKVKAVSAAAALTIGIGGPGPLKKGDDDDTTIRSKGEGGEETNNTAHEPNIKPSRDAPLSLEGLADDAIICTEGADAKGQVPAEEEQRQKRWRRTQQRERLEEDEETRKMEEAMERVLRRQMQMHGEEGKDENDMTWKWNRAEDVGEVAMKGAEEEETSKDEEKRPKSTKEANRIKAKVETKAAVNVAAARGVEAQTEEAKEHDLERTLRRQRMKHQEKVVATPLCEGAMEMKKKSEATAERTGKAAKGFKAATESHASKRRHLSDKDGADQRLPKTKQGTTKASWKNGLQLHDDGEKAAFPRVSSNDEPNLHEYDHNTIIAKEGSDDGAKLQRDDKKDVVTRENLHDGPKLSKDDKEGAIAKKDSNYGLEHQENEKEASITNSDSNDGSVLHEDGQNTAVALPPDKAKEEKAGGGGESPNPVAGAMSLEQLQRNIRASRANARAYADDRIRFKEELERNSMDKVMKRQARKEQERGQAEREEANEKVANVHLQEATERERTMKRHMEMGDKTEVATEISVASCQLANNSNNQKKSQPAKEMPSLSKPKKMETTQQVSTQQIKMGENAEVASGTLVANCQLSITNCRKKRNGQQAKERSLPSNPKKMGIVEKKKQRLTAEEGTKKKEVAPSGMKKKDARGQNNQLDPPGSTITNEETEQSTMKTCGLMDARAYADDRARFKEELERKPIEKVMQRHPWEEQERRQVDQEKARGEVKEVTVTAAEEGRRRHSQEATECKRAVKRDIKMGENIEAAAETYASSYHLSNKLTNNKKAQQAREMPSSFKPEKMETNNKVAMHQVKMAEKAGVSSGTPVAICHSSLKMSATKRRDQQSIETPPKPMGIRKAKKKPPKKKGDPGQKNRPDPPGSTTNIETARPTKKVVTSRFVDIASSCSEEQGESSTYFSMDYVTKSSPGLTAKFLSELPSEKTTTKLDSITPEPEEAGSRRQVQEEQEATREEEKRWRLQRKSEDGQRRTEQEKELRGLQETKGKQQADLVQNVLQHIARDNKSTKNVHYRVLGITSDAADGDIRRAYRRLSLRVHPDKNSSNRAAEAFHAVSTAYEALRTPTRRAEYDRDQEQQGRQTTVAPSFNIIPNGTCVIIQTNDPRLAHLNGTKGSVSGCDPHTGLYFIDLGGGLRVSLAAPALFQNVVVCLRAHSARELGGVFLVTLASRRGGGIYRASYCDPATGITRTASTLRATQFIIPNGTVVRLVGLTAAAGYGEEVAHDGRYGTIFDWKEVIDSRWGTDLSYYEVWLSSDVLVRVRMADVCL